MRSRGYFRFGDELLKSTSYKSIDAPIKLRLEFDVTTVGELSSILRQWQVLLRTAWRESYEINYQGSAPNARILVSSASTENSFEILTDIALPLAAIFGPVKEWPAVARTAYHYLASVWSEKEDQDYTIDSDHVYVRGGETPEIRVSAAALKDSETGQRLERMWEIANSGAIRLTVEELDDEDDQSPA